MALHKTLDNDPRAAGQARQAIAKFLDRTHLSKLSDDAQLLATELVTNAVRHGPVGPEDSVRLECRRAGDRLRFLVSERGRQLTGNGAALTLATHTTNGNPPSGWGLVLVERIGVENLL